CQLERRCCVRVLPRRTLPRLHPRDDAALRHEPSRSGQMSAAGLPQNTRADRILDTLRNVWVAAFLAYMFLPLAYMALAGFNASRFPTLLPWRGFTLEWFAAAADDPKLARAVVTSFAVAIAVVTLSTVLGLSGALFMTRVRTRANNLLYAVLVSPVLTPGIVLGLATAIFWDRAAEVSGFWGIAVLGQSSFISAYCMLIFIARLQRFDASLEEAALDLGATPSQIFRTITLPYLMPSI